MMQVVGGWGGGRWGGGRQGGRWGGKGWVGGGGGVKGGGGVGGGWGGWCGWGWGGGLPPLPTHPPLRFTREQTRVEYIRRCRLKNSIGVLTMSRDDRTRQWNWFNLGYAQYYGLSMLYRKHNLHNSFSCMDTCLHSTGTFLLFLER